MSKKKKEENLNPFRKNPDSKFAEIWDKVHSVDLKVTKNETDIKWLKKRSTLQLGMESLIAIFTFVVLVISLIPKVG